MVKALLCDRTYFENVLEKPRKKVKKLNSQLSQGEKKDRKRMAQVAAVYTVLPHVRTPQSIMKTEDEQDSKISTMQPSVRNKRVWASVER
jgi:predicted ribosome quality control (RQC) complex YloA/Tae2 family protein